MVSWLPARDDGRESAALLRRCFIFAALLIASWCVMTFTHECGHVIGGWIGGGNLQHVELRPWRLPYSIFESDPRPLVTLWSGPILGVAIPLVAAVLVRRRWMWFIAHFCVLANGAYLAAAWLSGDPLLDTPRLLQAGARPVSLIAYCTATILLGYVRFRADCAAVFTGQRLNAVM